MSELSHAEQDRTIEFQDNLPRLQGNKSIAMQALMWGVTRRPGPEVSSRDFIGGQEQLDGAAGHCSFITDTAELPQKGLRYF